MKDLGRWELRGYNIGRMGNGGELSATGDVEDFIGG